MEEIIAKLKEEFEKQFYKDYKECKIVYAIRYIEDNKKINKKQALEIVRMILQNRL